MVETYYIDRSQNIGDLRRSSKEPLSRPDFSNIRWIGVFGSFARGEQHDRSDVDIVVIEKFDTENVVLPSGSWTLEDLLPRVWCRPIDVIRIPKRELRGWISIHALLTSRTLYGDDKSEEVLQLRRDARKYLDDGKATFKQVDATIKTLQTTVKRTKVNDFMVSSETHNAIRDDLLKILNPLDIQPVWHPIHEGFWSAIIQLSVGIKRIVAAKNEDTKYWEQIWDIVAKPLPQSIQTLAISLDDYVFPTIQEIEESISIAKDLDKEDSEDLPVNGGSFRETTSRAKARVKSYGDRFCMIFCCGKQALRRKDE